MSMEYFGRDNAWLMYAIGPEDLTAWRNEDAKLIAAEVKGIDDLITFSSVGKPKVSFDRKRPIGFERYEQKVIKKARENGNFKAIFDFQTGRILNWILQNCSTTENSPVGYNTHDMSIKAGQNCQYLAFHSQRETTSDPLRNDLLGIAPLDYTLSMAEDGTGEQTIGVNVAKKLLTADCDNITKPAKCADSSFSWDELMYGGKTVTYGGTALGFDIKGFEFFIDNKILMAVKDSGGYSTVGKNKGCEFSMKLNGTPKDDGASIFTINDTDPQDYEAGGIDLVFKFARHLTNDYVQITLSNMVLEPFEEAQADEDQYYEEYEINLIVGDDSTLAIQTVDSYGKEYYENTA